jgi:putative phosphoesterase
MLVICSDTHSDTDHRLRDRLAEDVADADVLVHAGDFTTEPALDAFHDATDRLVAVHGNADSTAVRNRLPEATTFEYDGYRLAITHTREGGTMELGVFGRSRDADLVVFGHSHQPTVTETEDLTLLNPGSHADPRGNRPGYAVLEVTDHGELAGELREPDGTTIQTLTISS